nr:hypothetical protein [uncultured Flavobacterium sp.]
MRIVLFLIIALFSYQSYSQKNIEFYLKDQTQIKIKALNNFEKLEISNSKNDKTQIINNLEESLTEKETNFIIEDYNFDGFKDFAFYRLDDGMGVYSIYQIFIYNHKNQTFAKLKISSNCDPKCDEFCDVQINKKQKTFESSCRGGAQWHTDVWKFDKNNNLLLLNK